MRPDQNARTPTSFLDGGVVCVGGVGGVAYSSENPDRPGRPHRPGRQAKGDGGVEVEYAKGGPPTYHAEPGVVRGSWRWECPDCRTLHHSSRLGDVNSVCHAGIRPVRLVAEARSVPSCEGAGSVQRTSAARPSASQSDCGRSEQAGVPTHQAPADRAMAGTARGLADAVRTGRERG